MALKPPKKRINAGFQQCLTFAAGGCADEFKKKIKA